MKGNVVLLALANVYQNKLNAILVIFIKEKKIDEINKNYEN